MSNINYKKGFTLIELLVVVAIIGILASVVLASLNNARLKGNDAKVKSQLQSIRAAAEIYAIEHNNYGGDTNSCLGGMFTDLPSGLNGLTNLSNYPAGTWLMCNSNTIEWAVSANLNTASGKYWCVDSIGNSKEEPAQINGGAIPDFKCN